MTVAALNAVVEPTWGHGLLDAIVPTQLIPRLDRSSEGPYSGSNNAHTGPVIKARAYVLVAGLYGLFNVRIVQVWIFVG